MENGGEESGNDDEIEAALASLGIHPPFFWDNACSKAEFVRIAWSSFEAQAKYFNKLTSMTPERWQQWNTVNRACLWLRCGGKVRGQFPELLDELIEDNDAQRKVGEEFPQLLDELIENNDAQSLRRLHDARREGMLPNDQKWRAFLIEYWASPGNPLETKTPNIPHGKKEIRVLPEEALSWPFAFWADPALVEILKRVFPESRCTKKMIRDHITDFGLVRNKPTVVQFAVRFELRHYG